MGYWIINGKQLTNEEYMELIRQEESARDQVKQEAEQLLKRLGETYTALTSLVEQNAGIGFPICSDTEEAERSVFARLRENLQQADKAPRCQWIKEDGTVCRSPKMRNGDYCFAHVQMLEARPRKFKLPPLEDANAIQMAIMKVQQALIDDEISEKKAGLLLYSLQIAAANLGKTTFGERPEEMVTDSFTAKESKSLPLMNADGTDLNREIGSSGNRDIEGTGRKMPQSEKERDWGELLCHTSMVDPRAQAGVPVPHDDGVS